MFLALMVVGLAGLFMMAMPAFRRHGRLHAPHGHAAAAARGPSAHGPAIPRRAEALAEAMPVRLLRFVPSARAICSTMALYGASGNALVHAAHMRFGPAALAAVIPSLLVERFAVRPVYELLFRFEGQPSSPLETLLLCEATAVVRFRNGRGVVAVVRDGRVVQLAATLRAGDAAAPVNVGDRLRVEDVDARRERVTVSIAAHPQT